MRVNKKSGIEDDSYTVIELRESKGDDNEDQVLNYHNKNTNEIFDMKFANNYLILISFSKDVAIDQINKDDYKNGFSIVGYLSTQDKSNISETPKALTIVNDLKIKKFLKKEWTVCYVRPIEKITTFIR